MGGGELALQLSPLLRRGGDEQPARGLGVEEDGGQLVGDALRQAHLWLKNWRLRDSPPVRMPWAA